MDEPVNRHETRVGALIMLILAWVGMVIALIALIAQIPSGATRHEPATHAGGPWVAYFVGLSMIAFACGIVLALLSNRPDK